jgi:hypothetical protein
MSDMLIAIGYYVLVANLSFFGSCLFLAWYRGEFDKGDDK